MTRSDAKQVEKWREAVGEQRGSGLSVSAFCRKRGLVAHQFRYWQEKFAKEQPSKETPVLRFARAVPKRSEPCGEASLTLEIGQARIQIRAGFDRVLLREAVRALGAET